MLIFTENDIGAWHRAIFSDTNNKFGGRGKNDPVAGLTHGQRQSLLKQIYGTWRFYDGSAEDRPEKPYMTVENAGNPYLDLEEDKFPLESWQADAVYANHFLDAAEKLISRGQQAIFDTYHGYGVSDVKVVEDGEGETVDYTIENREKRITDRLKMFQMNEVDLSTVTSEEELQAAAPSWEIKGGWTTGRSFDGLQRRLIHAVTTNTKFTVVITGSWQSMGYGGNHAWQGMAGLFETLLKGIFEKLGVELVVRAIGLPPLSDLSIEDQATLMDGGKSTLLHTLGWSETSLKVLLDPTQVPETKPQLLYEGEDIENPIGKIPLGEVDALEIFELAGKRRRRQRVLGSNNLTADNNAEHDIYNHFNAQYTRRMEAITPGKGWQLQNGFGDGCDGSLSSSSTCGRLSSSSCLLEEHQGSRGGIWGNEANGWILFHHIKPENGFIALNLEIGGEKQESRRALQESLPDSFEFEYAIEGAITTLKKTEFLEKLQQPVPGVGNLVVMDDVKRTEVKEITVSVRTKGCTDEAECQFGVTHVYWS